MQRNRGFTLVESITLVEFIVVAAILLMLVRLLWPAFSAASAAANRKPEESAVSEPPQTHRLWTVQHDGHWWVMSTENFQHHPDCPCLSRKAEREDR